MKTQNLKLRLRWFTLSRLMARVTKPFSAVLLIILTIISLVTIRPALSQSSGNSQDSATQESPKFPLTIYRERLEKVDNKEKISFQEVGIGESFAVPQGSSLIVGNPPYPYQFTKASIIDEKSKQKDDEKSKESKEANPPQSTINITRGAESTNISLVNQTSGKLEVVASPPTITPEISPSDNAVEKPVLINASKSISFKIDNVPEFAPKSTNNQNVNQSFTWSSTPDNIIQITDNGNLNQFVKLSLKPPLAKPVDDTKEIDVKVVLADQVIGRIELIKTENANEWKVYKTENMLKTKSYYRNQLSISNRGLSFIVASLTTFGSYLLISLAAFWYRTRFSKLENPGNKNPSFNDLNPLSIASGVNGKVSLSRLQLLWFTLLVMWVLVYLFVQTGSLSDLPESVLALLGVSASGTILSGLTNLNKGRLSFQNWQWLKDQGWLTENRTPTRWTDLFLDEDGSFNIYKFQLLFSSILVGITLVLSGGNNLLGFKIPENFPQLLGLSNIAYVLGKVVTPTGVPELDTQVSELVSLEKGLKASTPNGLEPKKEELTTYLLKARNVAGMTKVVFADMGGTKFDDIKVIQDNELMPPWALPNRSIPAPSASPSDSFPQVLMQDRIDGARSQPDGAGLR